MTYAFDNNDPTTTADDSTVTDAYDSLGRIIEETQTIGSQPAQVIDSAWRADDLRKSLTYPNGRVEVYTYDALDRLKTVSDQGASQPIAIYDYIGEDRVLERIYPQNGTVETYLNNAGTADIGYDGDAAADRGARPAVRQLADRRASPTPTTGWATSSPQGKLYDPANSETYTYDSAYRLHHLQPGAGRDRAVAEQLDARRRRQLARGQRPVAAVLVDQRADPERPAAGGPATIALRQQRQRDRRRHLPVHLRRREPADRP